MVERSWANGLCHRKRFGLEWLVRIDDSASKSIATRPYDGSFVTTLREAATRCFGTNVEWVRLCLLGTSVRQRLQYNRGQRRGLILARMWFVDYLTFFSELSWARIVSLPPRLSCFRGLDRVVGGMEVAHN